MNLKQLFEKELLFEVKKDSYKNFKIFYKININLKRKKEESAPEAQPTPQPQSEVAPTPEIQSVQQPQPEVAPAPETQLSLNQPQEVNFSPSVVTEDGETEITDDNSIVRKLEGELELTKEEIDNIQTVEDILDKLKENKDPQILDELSYEFVSNMLTTNQLQQELKDKLEYKDSLVFVEIIYGKKKEESVGFRMIKRKNSDLISNSMLVDNQIINSQFSKSKLDQKIVDMRNEEYSEDE